MKSSRCMHNPVLGIISLAHKKLKRYVPFQLCNCTRALKQRERERFESCVCTHFKTLGMKWAIRGGRITQVHHHLAGRNACISNKPKKKRRNL